MKLLYTIIVFQFSRKVPFLFFQQGWLKDKGGKMPQLPNETRWNSQVACVETYVSNYNIYLEIRGEHEILIPANIGKIIDNVGIYREAQNLLSQLKLFGNALDQASTYCIIISLQA